MKILSILAIALTILSCNTSELPTGHYKLSLVVASGEDSPEDFYMTDAFQIGSNNDPMLHYRNTVHELRNNFQGYSITVKLDSIEYYSYFGDIDSRYHSVAVFHMDAASFTE